MQTETIKALNDKLNAKNIDISDIEMALQVEWNEVFKDMPVILDAVSKLEQSNDFTWDKYGEIASYIRFYDLADFQECRQYFEEYMRDTHFVNIDWDNDCLLYRHGECITIQDDTRHDNGVWLRSKCIIEESSYTDDDGEVNETKRNALIEAYMDKSGFFRGVFRTDSHGNISVVDTKEF